MAGNSPQQAGRVDDAGLEPWRRYFDGLDIFNVLSHAILVAATDSPQEFQRRRDSIVEQIYSAPAAVPVPATAAGEGPSSAARWHVSAENAGNNNGASTSLGGPPEEPAEKGMAALSDSQHVHGRGENSASAYAEVGLDCLYELANRIDEASKEKEEVLRIKAVLLDHQEQSVDFLFESLRRLQLMQLTVDILKSTEIGAAVAALEEHKSHEIRKLVQDIAKGWKATTDEWIANTKVAMAGESNKSLDHANSSAAEDEGLAIPPMDFGALILSQPTDIPPVSEFLDGIDDDGGIMDNHITSMDKDGGSGSRKQRGPRPSDTVAGTIQPIKVQDAAAQGSLFKRRNPENRSLGFGKDVVRLRRLEGQPLERDPKKIVNADETTVHKTQVVLPTRQEPISLATNLHETLEPERRRPFRIVIKNKPSSTKGEPRSPSKDTPEKTPHEDVKPRQDPRGVTVTRNSPIAAARKPPSRVVIKTGTSAQSSEDPDVGLLGKRKMHSADDTGLERTKRRLREAYQEAEDEKRKRTIQVMEPLDVPKPDKSPVRKSRRPIRRP